MRVKMFLKSIKYAGHGFSHLWRFENNFRIQIFVGAVAIALSWYFPFETWQRITVILLVALVLILEIVNSVFERLIDVMKSRVHPSVRDIKDMMAAAVLIASIVALVVGVMLFYPSVFDALYNFLVQ